MARARNLKPGFFLNDQLVELPFATRLLFIGLWTLADREGRMDDRPKKIKMSIFPADDVDVNDALDQLANARFIIRYQSGGQNYIQITNFVKHQQPHYKEVASQIPAPEGHEDSGVVSFGVSETRRQAIFDRDGRQCKKCGSKERLSLDHIIPRSLGGSEEDNNLQTLCVSCNASKNNRMADDSSSGQVQVNVDPTKSPDDLLNPSSLNPSSLNPSSLIPESLSSESLHTDGARVNSLGAAIQLFFDEILDGVKTELGLNTIRNEQLWVQAGEWAFDNGFTSALFLECFSLMRKQKWRNGAISPENLMDNLPNLEKLRNEIAEQTNGTGQKLSEREKSASRAANAESLADALERKGRAEIAEAAARSAERNALPGDSGPGYSKSNLVSQRTGFD